MLCRQGEQLHYPSCFKAGIEMIQVHCQGGIDVCGLFMTTPIVGQLLYALPHSCWIFVAKVSLYFFLFSAFASLIFQACTSTVIHGFLLGGIFAREVMV